MANLATIPKDVQLCIADYLPSTRDKSSLCLTCRTLQLAITPVLYRHVTLGYKHLNQIYSATLGISYIQTLRVTGPYKSDFIELVRLLNRTPRNALTRFELPSTCIVAPNVEHSLRTRQHKLLNYQYHRFARPGIALPEESYLSCVTCLQIYIWVIGDADLAGELLKRAKGVKRLAIQVDANVEANSIAKLASTGYARRGSYEQVREEVDSHLLKKIMSPARLTQQCLKIESLRLDRVSMGRAIAHDLPTWLLNNLKLLHLVDCPHDISLLQHLDHIFADLESFYLRPYHQESYGRIVKPLLTRMSSPKRLVIPSHVLGDLCYWANLMYCAPTIQCLSIGGKPWEPSVVHGFLKFCEGASKLQQLRLPLPWEAIKADMGPLDPKLSSFLDCLQPLCGLRILYLDVCPQDCFCRNQSVPRVPYRRLAFDAVLRSTADKTSEGWHILALVSLLWSSK